jgi:glutathione S-transferase
LNFKGLDYETEWLEYPDLAPKLKDLGVPPNPEGSPAAYSSPAIRLPDGTYAMDSRKIADALEALQPEPSLLLGSGYVERVQAAVDDARKPLTSLWMPRVPEMLLPERSAKYFSETRAVRVGMPLSEFAKQTIDWDAIGRGLETLKVIVSEHQTGPYILGEQASYADLILAGYWRFLERLDKGDVFERCMAYDESLRKQYEACRKWLERGD